MKIINLLRVLHLIIFTILISPLLLQILSKFGIENLKISNQFIYIALGVLGIIWMIFPESSVQSLYSSLNTVKTTRILGVIFFFASLKYLFL